MEFELGSYGRSINVLTNQPHKSSDTLFDEDIITIYN